MTLLRYILPLLILAILPNMAMAEDSPLSKLDSYDAERNPDVALVYEGREDFDEIINALKDAFGNWINLHDAVMSFAGEKREDAIFILKIMPHLDRLEMTKETLIEHVEYAWRAKTEFAYSIPDEMFREYILVYRLGDEPVTPYRAHLHERFADLAGDTPSETAKAVNEWINDNLTYQERGFFGNRPSPVSVLSAGIGTTNDVANLATAILKTLGVPSRPVRITSLGQQAGGAAWVEIYDNGWVPMYPDAPEAFGDFGFLEIGKPRNITVASAQSAFHVAQVTPAYTETGVIELIFQRRGKVQTGFEHYGVAVYNDGGYMPLDDLSDPLEDTSLLSGEEDITELILGNGTYLVQCAVRNYKGDPWVQTRMIDLKEGDRVRFEFTLDPPMEDLTQKDLVRRNVDPLPVFESDELSYPGDYAGNYHLIVFFRLDHEPSIRMLPEIARYRDSHTNHKVLLVHPGMPEEGLDDLSELGWDPEDVFIDETGEFAKAWKCPYSEEDGVFTSLPATILVNFDGTILLYDDGYNLMIHDFLERGFDFVTPAAG